MGVNYCPNCGSGYFELCKNTNFMFVCECGSKFEVNFFDKEIECED